MLVKAVISLAIYSATIFASNICEQKIPNILLQYSKNNIKVYGYKIKSCTDLAYDMPPVMNAHAKTNAPTVYQTNACAIILEMAPKSLNHIVVIDDENDFILERDFDQKTPSTISQSRFGSRNSGTLLYVKKNGDKLKSDGSLNKIEYITKAIYDAENSQIRLLKWKLGWFFNKYSHDYTVQCQ